MDTLFHYTEITEDVEQIIKQDPVRSNIPIHDRIGRNRCIAGIGDKSDPAAIVCYSLLDFIPEYEEDLFNHDQTPADNDIACLYTIWSIKKGAARKLVFEMLNYLKDRNIYRIVTLSPHTDMARRFHLNNGAVLFRVNELTVNYEYPL
jgi:hypothetical protein